MRHRRRKDKEKVKIFENSYWFLSQVEGGFVKRRDYERSVILKITCSKIIIVIPISEKTVYMLHK